MARRLFYVQELQARKATLRGETAQHLRKVLRAERGQRYEISDFESLWLAEITDFTKDAVHFDLLEPLDSVAPPVLCHLLPALIKFDHFEWILEKATELGVARITPVLAIRTERGLEQAAAKRSERWRRILYESGQQARRLRLPELDQPVRLDEALQSTATHRYWLEEQSGAPPILQTLPPQRHPDDTIALLCGPEGGWDDRERQSATQAGWSPVSLGRQILRAETAALAGLSILMAAWDAAPAS